LEKEPSVPITENQQKEEETVYLGIKIIARDYNINGVGLGITFTNRQKEHRYVNEPYFELSNNFEDSGTNTFYLIDKLLPLEFPHKLEYGQSFSVTYNLKAESIDIWKKMSLETTVTNSLGEKFKSNIISINEIIKIFNEIGIN